MRYRLDEEHNVIPEPDIRRWAEWVEKHENRRVAEDYVAEVYRVSTVFIGTWEGELFETMVFDDSQIDSLGLRGVDVGYQVRYQTWEEAVAGHEQAKEIMAMKIKREAGLLEEDLVE